MTPEDEAEYAHQQEWQPSREAPERPERPEQQNVAVRAEDEAVEAVARALYRSVYPGGIAHRRWHELHPKVSDCWRALARAAISAYREWLEGQKDATEAQTPRAEDLGFMGDPRKRDD